MSIRRSRRDPSPGPDPGPGPCTDSTRGTILSNNGTFGFIKPDIGGANVYFQTEVCYSGAEVGDYVKTTFTTDAKGRRSATQVVCRCALGKITNVTDTRGDFHPEDGGADISFDLGVCFSGARIGDFVKVNFSTDAKTAKRNVTSVVKVKIVKALGRVVSQTEDGAGEIRLDSSGQNVHYESKDVVTGELRLNQSVIVSYMQDQDVIRRVTRVEAERGSIEETGDEEVPGQIKNPN